MSTVLSNGVKIPDTGSTNWDVDVNNNFSLLNTAIGDIQGKVNSSDLANVATTGSYNDLADKPTIPTTVAELTDSSDYAKSASLAKVATSGSYEDLGDKPSIPTVNNATLTIQKNGTNVQTFSANQGTDATCNITVPTALETIANNNIAFHNAYPRCKYLGSSITDAQNTAIKNRTYDDLFIGDYWIDSSNITWRIVAIDYYYNVGDFTKGNILVMPDSVLYYAQMNSTNTTTGGYAGSLMRSTNLASAKSTASSAFGSHVASHRVLLCNAVDSSSEPSSWTWFDSAGVELPNEVQIYGSRAWSSSLKPFDMGSQFTRFPLFNSAINFVNIRQSYWLLDISSGGVAGTFALVGGDGYATYSGASASLGVRPAVTLTYTD